MKAWPDTRAKLIWIWVTFTLVSSTILSAPFLIDGISYFKGLVALVLVSISMPVVITTLFNKVTTKKIAISLFFLFLVNVSLVYLYTTSYRSVFGAPGRHNGLLNGIVCVYFFLIGIYARRFWKLIDLFRTISIVATIKSTAVITFTSLDFGTETVFSSNNLRSSDFSENTNLIAPLVCVGFISSLSTFRNTKKFIYLTFLVPISIVAVQLAVVQVYLCLVVSILVFLMSFFRGKFNSIWLLVTIVAGYFVGLFFALMGAFDADPSIKERTDILREAKTLLGDFTFLPSNFDTLSDFSQDFVSYYGNQYLDDFHNVFLQILFSYGLVIGVLFIVLSSIPYLPSSLPNRENFELLAVHSSLLVSLLIGISSQNYIYIYFILIGFSFAGYVKFDVLGRRSKSKSHALLWTLTIVLVMFPIGIQLKDYSTRAHISSVTKQINVIDPSSKSDFALLLVLLKDMDDAAYRELLARNFYTVGACSFGDDVYRMMTETNTNEVRLEALTALRLNCKQI